MSLAERRRGERRRAQHRAARRSRSSSRSLARAATPTARASRRSSTCSASTRPCRQISACSSTPRSGCTRRVPLHLRGRVRGTAATPSPASSASSSTAPGSCSSARACGSCPSRTRRTEAPRPRKPTRSRGSSTRSIGRTWTDEDGVEAELELQDVLVVAPYNAQVRLPDRPASPRARGSAPSTSSRARKRRSRSTRWPRRAPRTCRATWSSSTTCTASTSRCSRARCALDHRVQPELLRLHCRNPEQMRLVNALCLYEECAMPTGSARSGRRSGAVPALSVVS